MVNSMCMDCIKCGKSCKGTESGIYSGCIYKERAPKNAAQPFRSGGAYYMDCSLEVRSGVRDELRGEAK